MRILAAGSELAPTLPEAANFPWGGPAENFAPMFAPTRPFVLSLSKDAPRGAWPCLGRPGAAAVVPTRPILPIILRYRRMSCEETGPTPVLSKTSRGFSCRLRHAGFTLLELLVVVAIIAVATAGVSLSLRDSSQTALEREAQRLAVLFESARAQSRANGTAVIWRPTVDGFRFEGLPPGALPTRWLEAGTRAGANVAIQLGPEPIIGAQAVDILSGGQGDKQPARVLRIATDGLRPFALQTAEQP